MMTLFSPHPRERQLVRFASDEVPTDMRQAIVDHLGGCARCRAVVADARSVAARLATMAVPPARADGLDRVLRRRAMGARALLPLADDAAQPSVGAGRRVTQIVSTAAVVIVALSLSVLIGTSTRSLAAGDLDGILDVSPRSVKPGSRLRLEYRAGSVLSQATVLRVRGRYYAAGDREPAWSALYVVAATLSRDPDGVFRGSALLPDTIVYAQLVVEDTAGRIVDSHGGRLWEVLTADSTGAVSFVSLRQQVWATWARDPVVALQSARELTRRFPDSPEGWQLRSWYELDAAGPSKGDSVRRVFRPRLAILDKYWRGRPEVTEEQLADLATLAEELVVDDTRQYWSGRIASAARTGHGPSSERQRLNAIRDMSKPDSLFGALESFWADSLISVDARGSALWIAAIRLERSTDMQLLSRWGERMLASGEPNFRPWVAHSFLQAPALRQRAAALFRELLATYGRVTDAHRELNRSVEEQAPLNRKLRGYYFDGLGQALLADGALRAAVDTIAESVRNSWKRSAYQSLGTIRLSLADTLGAAAAFAHVAADPGASPDTVAMLRGRLARRPDIERRWAELVADARVDLRRDILADGVHRKVRGLVHLVDSAGNEHLLEDITKGAPAAVAFWSRWCPGSRSQLPGLSKARERLDVHSTPLLAITDERPSPALTKWLVEQQVKLDVYYDVRGEARRAFAAHGTPDQFILDRTGTIRFVGGEPDDLAPRIQALRE